MPTLPNMGLITPVVGSDIGAWGGKLNVICGLIDEHDHTSGKGLAITPAAMNIDDDLSIAGHSLTNVGMVAMSAVTAPASGLITLFVSSADNELYWRTNAGVNVKLTNGASINTTLVGGIVGDYSSVGAEVAFDNANKRYTFKSAASPGGKWSRLSSGPVRIYEYDTTESVYVEHAVAAALAAPYTVTWPAALAATQKLVQIDASGNVVLSNTLGVNENIELSGTGYVKTGDDSDFETFTSTWYIDAGSPPSMGSGAGSPDRVTVAASSRVYYQIRLGNSRRRIKGITVYMRAFASPTTLSLYLTTGIGTGATGTSAQNLTGGTTATTLDVAADGLANPRTLTLTSTFTPSGGPLWLYVDTIAGGTAALYTYKVNYDVP